MRQLKTIRRGGITLAVAASLIVAPVGSAVADEAPGGEIPAVTIPTGTIGDGSVEIETTPEPPAETTPTPDGEAAEPEAAGETQAEPIDPPPAVEEPVSTAPKGSSPKRTTSDPTDSASDEATTTTSDTGAREVDAAQLRWAINQESNARAYAPNTFNFMSAGKVADPGQGAQTLTTASQGRNWSNGKAAGWSASSGNVSLEKWNGASYGPADWSGLSTDTSGQPLGGAGQGTHSGHQVVFDEGTGTVDPDAGTAEITWDGDFTVLYYSGMTFFYVSDPKLTVANGTGKVTATLSGHASSMEDMTLWEPVAPRTVTLADLPEVELEADDRGLTVTPAYAHVKLQNTPEQVTSGPVWGSFPQSFVEFQKSAGSAPYWYSSGGAADKLKAAAPLSVSYDRADPVALVDPDRDPTAPAPDPDPDPTDPEPTDPEPTDPEPSDPGSEKIDAAQLRWAVNQESNARAFAPGTFNFLSAGKVRNPGQGAQTLTTASKGRTWSNGKAAGWSATSGNVSLEKSNGTSYRRASWAGLSTDTSGQALGSAGQGTHSGHQVVFDNGTGTIDSDAGTAQIGWDGDFTVLYYSGMTFFYVSDPKLTVANGTGKVTATLSGYASSMEDMTRWEPVTPKTVTLADLPSVTIAKNGKGFTVNPAYRGVKLPSSYNQVTTGPDVGSFPRSFVDFQQTAGSAAYWFSSGGAADKLKVAAPLTVSYDSADPVTVRPPSSNSSTTTDDPVANEALAPPSFANQNAFASRPLSAAPVAAPAVAPLGEAVPFVQAASASTMSADQLAAQTAEALWWWLGIVLLTLAAGSVAGTFAYSAAASRRVSG